MTLRRTEHAIILAGDCPVEDAETLLALLGDAPALPVDLAGCGRLHTAIVQLLLAARPRILGTPANAFAREWVLPHLLDAEAESTFTRTTGTLGAVSMTSLSESE